jgi:hypothetical protein
VRDVDVEVRLEAENQKSIKRQDAQLGVLTSALNASRNGFAIWKAIRDEHEEIVSFTLVFINDVGAAPTGIMPRHLVGGRIEEVVGQKDSIDLRNLFTHALEDHTMQSEVLQLESPSGWVGAYLNEVVPFTDDQVLASFRDVSEEQRERDRLNWLAQHDHLTGLPNRRNLEEILEKSLNRVVGTKAFIAFAFVDIDDFKNVNDQHGHAVALQRGCLAFLRLVETHAVGDRAIGLGTSGHAQRQPGHAAIGCRAAAAGCGRKTLCRQRVPRSAGGFAPRRRAGGQ